MKLELVNVIKEFCEMFKFEYLDGEFELVTTDDIAEYVKRDDEEYYEGSKRQLIGADGALYENSEGKTLLLIKEDLQTLRKADIVVHEYVHLHDYKKCVEKTHCRSLRETTVENGFGHWSEFHASYMAARYRIAVSGAPYPQKSAQTMELNVCKNMIYQGRDTHWIAIYTAICTCGQYMAIYEAYPNEVSPVPTILNTYDAFMQIYRFYFTHRTIDKFLQDSKELERLIDKL